MPAKLSECSVRASESPTNMYVDAVLRDGDFSLPAKIRSMSPSEALVEASPVPEPGSDVRLICGCLEADGTVSWAAPGRCAIRFTSGVSVEEWLSPIANREQQRIDQIITLLRTGAVLRRELRRNSSPVEPAFELSPSAQLSNDVGEVALLLDELGAALAEYEDVIARAGGKLQNLDIASQTLRAVCEALTSNAGGQDDISLRLNNVRVSRRRALEALG